MKRETITFSNGYVARYAPDHPRAMKVHGRVYEHVLVAEAALGKLLPPKAQVHHFNGNKADNRTENLVVCEDNAYHALLHVRQAALAATGDARSRRCNICGAWESTQHMNGCRTRAFQWVHPACAKEVKARNKGQRRERDRRNNGFYERHPDVRPGEFCYVAGKL